MMDDNSRLDMIDVELAREQEERLKRYQMAKIKAGDWVRVVWKDNEYAEYQILHRPNEIDRFFECVDKSGTPTIIMQFDMMYKIAGSTAKAGE